MKRANYGRNRNAVELTILALHNLGRLEAIDSAKVATAQTLADAVDADPTNASLWREYRAAEQSLRESNDTTADEFAQLLAALSAEMGDPKTTGTTESRTRNRNNR